MFSSAFSEGRSCVLLFVILCEGLGGVLTFLSKVLFRQIQVWSSVVSKKLESNALSGSGKTMHRILWNQNFSCGLFYVDLLPRTQMAVIAPSCQRLDPGAYHCHFLTACPGALWTCTITCAIVSTKWNLRPIGTVLKCSYEVCWDYQWSRALRRAAKYMHRSVFSHNYDKNDRKDFYVI